MHRNSTSFKRNLQTLVERIAAKRSDGDYNGKTRSGVLFPAGGLACPVSDPDAVVPSQTLTPLSTKPPSNRRMFPPSTSAPTRASTPTSPGLLRGSSSLHVRPTPPRATSPLCLRAPCEQSPGSVETVAPSWPGFPFPEERPEEASASRVPLPCPVPSRRHRRWPALPPSIRLIL